MKVFVLRIGKTGAPLEAEVDSGATIAVVLRSLGIDAAGSMISHYDGLETKRAELTTRVSDGDKVILNANYEGGGA